MSIYLETNALIKLTNYKCEEHTYTSIFSIFELLSGISEKNFEKRKAYLKRIKKQRIEIRGPMVDTLFQNLVGGFDKTNCNQFAYKMIKDIFREALTAPSYSCLNDLKLVVTTSSNEKKEIHALTWLKKRDERISEIIHRTNCIFQNENEEYIRKIYNNEGVNGLAKYFWQKMYDARIDEDRLGHAEPFIGVDETNAFRKRIDTLFSTYNFKLFMIAQYAVFSKAFFVNGNTQDRNNPSDLLHLLYLSENDKFVSNDKIYQMISEACENNVIFNFVRLNNEKSVADLIKN